jgi:site-specific DNA-methyltransferase (adenine-specific)
MEKLKIEYVGIDSIKPYKNNAKQHPAEQIEQIKNSIEQFGMDDPIGVWNDEIVEGHGRLIACKELGYTEVPIIRLDHLTDEERKAYTLAHNKLTMNSDFDIDILNDELMNLFDTIDMSDFGFDLDFDVEEEQEIVEDEVPEVPEEPKAKLGDIYQLGNHRLMCGDSTSEEDVAKLMNGVQADISFTSPPYNAGSLNIEGDERTQKKYNQYNDNKTEEDYYYFLKENMKLLLKNSNEVFYNIGLVENNKKSIIKLQYDFINYFKDIIYWEKNTCAPHIQPGIINNLVEFILCFGNGKRKFQEAQFKQGTYWNVIKGNNASENEYSKIHKATFPLYLPIEIIKNFCNEEGIVIDSFGGTGTTLIACEQLNRTCYMMELDPKYIDVIIQRWENFTGEKAVLLNE